VHAEQGKTQEHRGHNLSRYGRGGEPKRAGEGAGAASGTQAGRTTLTVKAGQTYSYTAAWSGSNLVLVRNQ